MHAFSVDLLGPIEVRRTGIVIHSGPIRQRELLAALALRCGTAVPIPQLAADLWGPEPPNTVDNLVHTYVARLRRLLEPAVRASRATLLRSTPAGYLLDVDAEQVDVMRFERLLDGARRARRRGDQELVCRLLTDALALWHGEPLQGTTGPRAQTERWRLNELRIEAAEELVEARLAIGDYVSLVAELRRVLTENPLRERSWALLLTALDRTSRRGEALIAYGEARRTLVEQLGIEPGAELHRVYRTLLDADRAVAPRRDQSVHATVRNVPMPA